ncbi:MAG: type IV secretory system conjugative DNA transfer family protein [Acaryochloris sp. RU_4_1]|nr:type IV secretory system conjugative DNA transfer family protein [Acaryochloris sp. RU_4_1]
MQQHHTTQLPPRRTGLPDLQINYGWISIAFLTLLFILWLASKNKRRTKVPDGMPMAREATPKEIKQGTHTARLIRAETDLEQTAVRLNHETGIILGPVNPGGIASGKSGGGKTANVAVPVIESHAEDGASLLICDIKGDLMKKTAGYLHHLGYDIHCLAPGIKVPSQQSLEPLPFSGGLNLLDLIENDEDLAGTLELTRGININAAENHERRHQYFGPQSDLLQQSMMLAAKSSEYDDMLMVWELMGLTQVAERLAAAKEHNKMGGEGLPYFMTHLSRGLRSVAFSSNSSNPGPTIQSTASQTWVQFLDPGVAKCLSKTTIPIDLMGKQAIYFRINEDQIEATSSIITAAIHMIVKRNISYTRKRENNLVLIAEEASFYPLPDLPKWAALGRQNGFICWMLYQQEEQMHDKYGKERWEIIAANLPTRIYMNQGSPKSNQIVSTRLGQTTIIATTENESFGSSRTLNRNDSFQKVDLITSDRLDAMKKPGQCIIVDACTNGHPMFYEKTQLPYDENSPQAQVREQCQQAWESKILPSLQEEHQKHFGDMNIQVAMQDRAETAIDLLPHPEFYEIEREAAEIDQEAADQEEQEDD